MDDSRYNKKYFDLDEGINHESFILRPNFELLPLENTTGSFAVLPARLLGLTYVDYLRMCRDILGAEIIGKGSKYPVVYFQKKAATRQFIKLLNGRTGIALFEREHRSAALREKIEELKQKLKEEKC